MALVNFMAGRLLQRREDSSLLMEIDISIFQGLHSYSQTPDEWMADPIGLPSMTSVFSHNYPEMFGAMRPIMVAGCEQDREEGHSMRIFLPIRERFTALCRRIKNHVRLRQLSNRDKRLTIVLHSNPCKGVEATVGMAVGLDSFQSLGRLLARLAAEGYDIGNVPTESREILAEFQRCKALAEFRWTTIDEIVDKGGALTFVGRDEYITGLTNWMKRCRLRSTTTGVFSRARAWSGRRMAVRCWSSLACATATSTLSTNPSSAVTGPSVPRPGRSTGYERNRGLAGRRG
jgi:cobaltochelatase CobN